MASIPEPVQRWLAEEGHGQVVSSQAVGGGCINQGTRLVTEGGVSFFLKLNAHTPPDMFTREAEGLQTLAIPDGPRVPRPYLAGETFLLLEDLRPGPQAPAYWRTFGQQLAALHLVTHDRFGFAHNNYIGSTPQPNDWTPDGFDFFQIQRLGYQTRLARERGYLSSQDVRRIESLGARLPELIPEQPASLIHGDLWSGNALTDERGWPALIDPAAYYGWAEAELGMTALFGGFPGELYQAYGQVKPLVPGYRERFPIYNLYHLLNHVNLFGRGYLGQVQTVLRQFA